MERPTKDVRILHFPDAGSNGRGTPISVAYLNHGVFHNDEDPAITCVDGSVEYWLDGKRVSRKDHDENKKKVQVERLRKKGFRISDEGELE